MGRSISFGARSERALAIRFLARQRAHGAALGGRTVMIALFVIIAAVLVPWKRDVSHNSRAGHPG